MKFNDQQLQTISNCLRVAAERFKENAAAVRGETQPIIAPGFNRIAEQFDRQQREAEELAHIIDSKDDAPSMGSADAYAVPPGLRRRRGVEYGCGLADCGQCYELRP